MRTTIAELNCLTTADLELLLLISGDSDDYQGRVRMLLNARRLPPPWPPPTPSVPPSSPPPCPWQEQPRQQMLHLTTSAELDCLTTADLEELLLIEGNSLEYRVRVHIILYTRCMLSSSPPPLPPPPLASCLSDSIASRADRR